MTISLAPGSQVAVVGGGVAGVVAAFLLQRRYQVTLYEAQSKLGGHTNTVQIERGPDAGTAVDTGFIVLNNQNYPLFTQFLKQLNVPIRSSDMSFAFEDRESGFTYAGSTLNGLFADRKNLLSPTFYRFLGEILRFCRVGQKLLAVGSEVGSISLGAFLKAGRYSDLMRDCYLLPMGAAIWSVPLGQVLEFPVHNFLHFFANHGLLSLRNRPQWQTVVGGSHQYLKAFQRSFKGTIRLNAPVKLIETSEAGSIVTEENGESAQYDATVIAAHADQALRLLGDATPAERELLGAWRYQSNRTVLHTDISHLPTNRRAWASWNYSRGDEVNAGSPVAVTYHMNRLQGLETREQYCVTLNPSRPIPQGKIVAEFNYDHPIFDARSVASQPRLSALQGERRRFFCGSYFGYGFHEDAVRSAVRVGKLLEVEL